MLNNPPALIFSTVMSNSPKLSLKKRLNSNSSFQTTQTQSEFSGSEFPSSYFVYGDTSYLSGSSSSVSTSLSENEENRKFENSVKYKTEICKNFQLFAKCKFGLKCCFAHGIDELRERTQLNNSYKLKVCKNYQEIGYCKYGHRCQYVHFKENEFFNEVLTTTLNKVGSRLAEKTGEKLEEVLNQANALQSPLPVFQAILKKKGNRL